MGQLVLSLFPGIGLLDMAFEEEGFCVVRGPDLLWGGDIRQFHPPTGKFDGVIGGPPCQTHSTLRHLAFRGNGVPAGVHGDRIPEFERCVREAEPAWFVMENVPGAPIPTVEGYGVRARLIRDVAVGGQTTRLRRFSLGRRGLTARNAVRFDVDELALHRPDPELTVLAGHGPAMGQRARGIGDRDWKTMARLQGVPEERIAILEVDAPFTIHGLKSGIGNGVPLPMGRAVARAVKRAIGMEVAA